MIHMEYYLVVSTIMMFAGIYGFFTRRNTLAILISVELMLNATDINFAVFNRFLFPEGMEVSKTARNQYTAKRGFPQRKTALSYCILVR